MNRKLEGGNNDNSIIQDLINLKGQITKMIAGREVRLYQRHDAIFMEYGLERANSDGFVAVFDKKTMEVRSCNAKGDINSYPTAKFIIEEIINLDCYKEDIKRAHRNRETLRIVRQQLEAKKKIQRVLNS